MTLSQIHEEIIRLEIELENDKKRGDVKLTKETPEQKD